MSILTRKRLIGATAFMIAAGGAYFSNNNGMEYQNKAAVQTPLAVESKKAPVQVYRAETIENKATSDTVTFMPASSLEKKLEDYRMSKDAAPKLDSLAGHYKFDEIIEIWNENQDILQDYKLDFDIINGYKAAQIVPNSQADRAEIAKALQEMREATQGIIFTSPTIPAPISK